MAKLCYSLSVHHGRRHDEIPFRTIEDGAHFLVVKMCYNKFQKSV